MYVLPSASDFPRASSTALSTSSRRTIPSAPETFAEPVLRKPLMCVPLIPRHTDFIGVSLECSAITIATCACAAAFTTSQMSAFFTPDVVA